MTPVVLSCRLARRLVPAILISAAIVTVKPVIPLFISVSLPLSLSLTIIHALFSACSNPCQRQMLNWSHIRSCIQVCLCHLDYHANLLLPATSCRQRIKTAIFCGANINLVKVDCTNLLKWRLNLNALFKHACISTLEIKAPRII